MGVEGLEPTKPIGETFTVSCNCRYAILPIVLGTGFEPVTFPVKGGCPKPARRTERLKKIAYNVHIIPL